jgi:hypothetical protein
MKTLVEIGRKVYGHDATAINRHSERMYRDENNMRYILSKTLDGVPPFYEAYGPYKEDHEGVLPSLPVDGKQYWGDGWTWQRAEQAFCRQVEAVVARPANQVREQQASTTERR